MSLSVGTSTLAERDAFVSAEDQARVADTSLHTRLVAGAAGAPGVLTAGLGAGGAARVVLTAWGALKSWRERTIANRVIIVK